MGQRLPFLLCVILASSWACKDEDFLGVAPPKPATETPPKQPRDAAQDAAELPKVTQEGVILFDRKASSQMSAAWPIGDGQTVFVGKAGTDAKKVQARVDVVRGKKSTEVIRCADKEFDNALFIKAYLQSRDVVFVVCESPHGEAKPGRSVGVRLQWKDGEVELAGRFENEGPPAYETMDFGEEELVPGAD